MNAWMSDLEAKFPSEWRSTKLNQLTVLGTHHSPTGNKYNSKNVIQKSHFWPRIVPRRFLDATLHNQTVPIASQLRSGIRYLDLRPLLVNNSTLLHHHCAESASISEALVNVKDFLSENPRELIFIEVQFDCLVKLKHYSDSTRTKTIEVFTELVGEILGELVYSRVVSPDTELGTLLDSPARVVIWIEQYDLAKEFGCGFSSKELLMEDTWNRKTHRQTVRQIHTYNTSFPESLKILKRQHLKKITVAELLRRRKNQMARNSDKLHGLLAEDISTGFWLLDRFDPDCESSILLVLSMIDHNILRLTGQK